MKEENQQQQQLHITSHHTIVIQIEANVKDGPSSDFQSIVKQCNALA